MNLESIEKSMPVMPFILAMFFFLMLCFFLYIQNQSNQESQEDQIFGQVVYEKTPDGWQVKYFVSDKNFISDKKIKNTQDLLNQKLK